MNAVGNIKEKQVNTGMQYYGYDDLYQLTDYAGAAIKDIAYGYDYAGNRVSMDVEGEETVEYKIANNNKTTSIVNLKNISYERGNMTVKGGDVYEYDYKNRMVSATVPSGNISYLYNTNDRRIRRVKNGKAVYYFYNHNKLLCEKYSGNKLSKVYTNDDVGVLGMKRYAYDKDTDEFLTTQKEL